MREFTSGEIVPVTSQCAGMFLVVSAGMSFADAMVVCAKSLGLVSEEQVTAWAEKGTMRPVVPTVTTNRSLEFFIGPPNITRHSNIPGCCADSGAFRIVRTHPSMGATVMRLVDKSLLDCDVCGRPY